MQQAFHQFLQFLQQGIASIFHFVQLIWTWAVDQIGRLVAVPWQSWPLWKQILLVIVLAGVVWALYRAARELFEAGEKILAAFASLLGVLVRTLPSVVLAGLIAVGGVWVMNHLDNTPLHLPVALQLSPSTDVSPTTTTEQPTVNR